MKFLFFYVEIRENFVKNYTGGYSEGVASICTYLQSLGHDVKLLHITKPEQLDKDTLLNQVSNFKPDLSGFSVMSPSFKFARQINNLIKKELRIKTIIGGPHAMFDYARILRKDNFDFVALGEGEVILPRLLSNLGNGSGVKNNIPGILTRPDNFDLPLKESMVKNLDDLPTPDRSFFDFKNLRESKERQVYFMSGRGCPYKCTYCPNLFKNRLLGSWKIRNKSPDRFIDEIDDVLKTYPFIQVLVFQDDILPLNKKWFSKFAELYKTRINKPFICNIHPNCITDEICKNLAEMKCASVVTGLESGSERIRREILLRNISNENLIKKFQILKNYGLGLSTYNMVGHYSETMEEALETIKFNAKLNPTRSACTILIPYPGTRLNERCREENGFIGEKEPEEYPEFTDTPIMKCDNLSPAQIIFFKKYFNILKRMYQVLPHGLLDQILTYKYFPYSLLNKMMNWARPKLISIYLNFVAKFYNRFMR